MCEEGRTFLIYLQAISAPLANYQILVVEIDPGSHKTYVVFLEEKLSIMIWAALDDAELMLAELLDSYQDDVHILNPVSHMLAYGTVNRGGAVISSPVPDKVLH